MGVDVVGLCRDSVQKLIDWGLIVQTRTQSEDPEQSELQYSLDVTPLGRATFKGMALNLPLWHLETL